MSGNGSIGAASYARTINRTPPSAGVFRLDTPRTRKVRKEKAKKMNWFKRKFAQWSREAWENGRNETVDHDVIKSVDTINGKTSVRFTIYPASGGFVIEHYKQDRYKDGDGPTLTIVPSSDEIGKAVEHILAIEALKA